MSAFVIKAAFLTHTLERTRLYETHVFLEIITVTVACYCNALCT